MISRDAEERAYELHCRAETASDLRRYTDAQALAMEAISLDPQLGQGYASLGRALLGQHKAAEAEKQFRQALSIDPASVWYLRGVAICLQVQRKFQDALHIANTVIELAPDIAENFSLRGDIQTLLKKDRLAINDFQKAIELNPELADAHFGLGDAYLAVKENAKGEASYRQGLSIFPQSARALNNLGVALEKQSKLKEAALAYKAAILVDPTFDVAKRNTKLAVDRYLGIGLGSAGLIIYLLIKTASFASNSGSDQPAAVGIVFVVALVILGAVAIHRWSKCRDRKEELAAEDPQLLEIYETIKKHGHTSS